LQFAGLASAGLAASRLLPAAAASPIIDTHVHFYDPSRPEGVPWPPKDDKLLYRAVLPEEYKKLTAHLGITGAIEVEASPLLEDNQWVLDLAANNPIIIGTVGHLEPGKAGFERDLDRFHENRRFLGIRVAGKSLSAENAQADFIRDLKKLAAAGLEMDAIGGPAVLTDVVRISEQVPKLRIVINHMPFDPPENPNARALYENALREIARRPQIYAKVSGVLRRKDDRLVEAATFYRPSLDELWDIFGVNRVIYGSNWPVSDKVGPYDAVFRVVREYFASKGPEASEKYLWKNSKAAYRWKG
jgi:predicted TIM-barrel fold metal-dependent hydrolase